MLFSTESTFVGFSDADELVKLKRLKFEKAISDPEYARPRARIVQ